MYILILFISLTHYDYKSRTFEIDERSVATSVASHNAPIRSVH